MKKIFSSKGFSLLELVVVLLLMAILAGVGSRGATTMDDATRFEKTVTAMENIRKALIGDQNLVQVGRRASFGYWGNREAFPASLDLLWSQYQLTSGNYQIGDIDFWGRPYIYDGPTGTAGYLNVTSYGADGAAGGTGYNADLSFRIRMSDYNANTIIIYCMDKNGTLLLPMHLTNVDVANATCVTFTPATYESTGKWRCTPLKAGPAYLDVTVNLAYAPNLCGQSSINFITMPIVIQPKASFSNNEENIFEFRFPGALP